MPIDKTGAPLWFNTKEEEEAYDDMMMANIELKSDEFGTDNYAIVFTREKNEKFYHESEIHKSTRTQWESMTKMSPDEHYNKYGKKFAKNDTWRMWPIVKQQLGFGAAYLLLRELPIRNFYARSFVMTAFLIRYFNFYGVPFIPSYIKQYGNIKLDQDEGTENKLKNFPILWLAASSIHIPNTTNQLPEDIHHALQQPGHHSLRHSYDLKSVGVNFGSEREIAWDGTHNMPLDSLADKYHKYGTAHRFA